MGRGGCDDPGGAVGMWIGGGDPGMCQSERSKRVLRSCGFNVVTDEIMMKLV